MLAHHKNVPHELSGLAQTRLTPGRDGRSEIRGVHIRSEQIIDLGHLKFSLLYSVKHAYLTIIELGYYEFHFVENTYSTRVDLEHLKFHYFTLS